MLSNQQTNGWIAGFIAFILWGIFPIYFKAVDSVSSAEILAHRVAWCVPFMLVLMMILRKKLLIKEIFANKRLFAGLVLSTILISSNWYIFTWAVTHDQILATSLGYFINPIMSILLGVLFLHEKLTRLQWIAVVIVCLGVLNQIINYGQFPWIALSLATTFALYGFVRKKLQVDALNGLLVETGIALPVAAAYIFWMLSEHSAVFLQSSIKMDLLLILGGAVTALPLIFFAAAAKRIPLNSVGFIQFTAPTISFILATQLYHEALGKEQLVSFILIWIGLLFYIFKPIKQVFLGARS